MWIPLVLLQLGSILGWDSHTNWARNVSLTFIRFSAYRTRIGTVPKWGERGHSETHFRHKKHWNGLSKTRDMQIRISDKISELAM